jgi:hypothetical protein
MGTQTQLRALCGRTIIWRRAADWAVTRQQHMQLGADKGSEWARAKYGVKHRTEQV